MLRLSGLMSQAEARTCRRFSMRLTREKSRNAEIAAVISNNPGAYALERARQHGMWKQSVLSPKDLSRAERRSIRRS